MQSLFEIMSWIFFTSVTPWFFKIALGLTILLSLDYVRRSLYSGRPPIWSYHPTHFVVVSTIVHLLLVWVAAFIGWMLFFTFLALQFHLIALLF